MNEKLWDRVSRFLQFKNKLVIGFSDHEPYRIVLFQSGDGYIGNNQKDWDYGWKFEIVFEFDSFEDLERKLQARGY